MGKAFNYYKLLEITPKKKKFKVKNFKKNHIEVYSFLFKDSKKKVPVPQTELKKSKVLKGLIKASFLNISQKNQNFSFKILFSLYLKYKKHPFLSKNDFFLKYIFLKFSQNYNKEFKKKSLFQNFYDVQTKEANFFKEKESKAPDLISIHVILKQNNIFVTVIKNDEEVLKVFSSGMFAGIERSDRKRSPSFFTVIKKTLYYLRPYIRSSRKDFLFKLIFKGFKRFRRPLINRFFFNKGFRSKCVGILNLDSEPFNGCRKRKSKRVKLKRKN